MIDESLSAISSPIHRLDPRPRILAAVAFAVFIALSGKFVIAGAGLALGLALVTLARAPWRTLAGRLAAVNGFILFLWLFLPFTEAGAPLGQLGPLTATREGVLHATLITMKCNAIVLTVMALMATIEIVRFGHALHHLYVPDKLVHLFLFTVRYAHVFSAEHHRLATAMKARGFRPRTDVRTLRMFGYLVGMLLVRSFDRSDRIMAAMKCRGFRGTLWMIHHFHWARRDAVFACVAALFLVGLGWLQWATAIR